MFFFLPLSHDFSMMLAIICPLFFEVITFKVFDISGTENKGRSLHDGPKRWDIPSFLVYYECFAGKFCSFSLTESL